MADRKLTATEQTILLNLVLDGPLAESALIKQVGRNPKYIKERLRLLTQEGQVFYTLTSADTERTWVITPPPKGTDPLQEWLDAEYPNRVRITLREWLAQPVGPEPVRTVPTFRAAKSEYDPSDFILNRGTEQPNA